MIRLAQSPEEKEALRAEVIALAQEGLRPVLIYNKLAHRCYYPFVMNTIAGARKKGISIPDFRNQCGKRHPGALKTPAKPTEEKPLLSDAALQYFGKHAEQREITTERLCARILETIARDDMILAVLDDGDAA